MTFSISLISGVASEDWNSLKVMKEACVEGADVSVGADVGDVEGKSVGDHVSVVGACDGSCDSVGDMVGEPRQRPVRSEQGSPSQKP